MPPTEQYWAEKDIKKEKQIAYFNSNNAAVEMVNGKPPKAEWNAEFYQRQIKFWRDFFYKEWENWYADNIVEPQGADGEEPIVQEKITKEE